MANGAASGVASGAANGSKPGEDFVLQFISSIYKTSVF